MFKALDVVFLRIKRKVAGTGIPATLVPIPLCEGASVLILVTKISVYQRPKLSQPE